LIVRLEVVHCGKCAERTTTMDAIILATSTLLFVVLFGCFGIGWGVSLMIACAVEAAFWLGYRVGAMWAFRHAETYETNDADTRFVNRRAI
jgi:hypothetical protein